VTDTETISKAAGGKLRAKYIAQTTAFDETESIIIATINLKEHII
jgi:hypothetical protein